MLEFVLPFPPSVNHYYRRPPDRPVMISRKGRAYREAVRSAVAALGIEPMSGYLKVWIELFPPEGMDPDVDNFSKPLLDSLQHSRLYANDKVVKRQLVDMNPPCGQGHTLIRVGRMKWPRG